MQRNATSSALLHWIAIGALGCALLLSCSGDDDDDASDAGEDPRGEPCAQPGYTETGCQCDSGARGRRQCQANSRWEPCRCPPATQQCVAGQDVECFLCPGETEPRITKCLQGGTFDCACDQSSGDSGRGGGD